jgi:hypothetical protein
MKMMNKYIFLILVSILIFLGNVYVFSQGGNTLYYMGTVPQSYYLNPATQPQCNVFIGIPIASQINVRATTSGLSASDIFFKDPESDSIITPLHPNADIDDFLSKFGDVESFGLEANFNLLSFGFRAKEMYISFDASIRNSAYASYSKDFVTLLLKPENGRTYDLSDGGIDLLEYTEFGLNISRRFGDQLQVGIRPKLLYGLATISTISNNSSFYTSADEWVLSANYEARIAATGVTIPVDEDGLIDFDQDFEFDSTILSPTGYKKILSSNRGFGIDFGVHYKPIERLQLSLSVLDLGYIKWVENTHIASVNGTFTYTGLEVSLDSTDIDLEGGVLDSLKENLNLTGTDEAFKTKLNPKLLVGARYFLTPGFDIGVLSRTEFYRTYINQDIILLANWHPIPMIAVSGSYSILSKTHSTFGLGLGLKLGPFNVYAVLDDIPLQYDDASSDGSSMPVIIPVKQTDYNIRFGVNLMFGCNQKKKLMLDKPLFNSSDWIL